MPLLKEQYSKQLKWVQKSRILNISIVSSVPDSKLTRVASLRTRGKWQWQVTSLTLGGSANAYICIVLLFANINQHTVCELLCQVESAVSKEFAGFLSK